MSTPQFYPSFGERTRTQFLYTTFEYGGHSYGVKDDTAHHSPPGPQPARTYLGAAFGRLAQPAHMRPPRH